jgi:hypothetical protein
VAERRPPGGVFATPRPARRGRVALAILLLVAAAGLLVWGLVRQRAPDPAPAALADFSLPAGWADRTAELAPRVKGVRPAYVFSGPVTGNFSADINIVRQPRAATDPPLGRLVELVQDQVRTELRAAVTAQPKPLRMGGEPALAYDYRYTAAGTKLRARQVAVYRGGNVVFVNFTSDERSFDRDVKALDRLTSSWRWR